MLSSIHNHLDTPATLVLLVVVGIVVWAIYKFFDDNQTGSLT